MAWKYLLTDVDMGETEAQAVAEVVRSKWLSQGPRTAEFEARFAEFLGVKHAVAVSSCTAALHLALAAMGVGPGDEVLVPSYTFVASANAILYQGATPVFVDITGPEDLNLDPADLEQKITPRSKAVIAVHLAGFPADMSRIMAIASRHRLAVVEDSCHAIGAPVRLNPPSGDSFVERASSPSNSATKQSSSQNADRPVLTRSYPMAGTVGQAGCFSFFATKNLVTGEGGMLVTNDDSIADRARLGRTHGMTKSSWDKAEGRAAGYDVVTPGYNYRTTELASALGLVQLAKLPAANARRRELAALYRRHLSGLPRVTIPFAHRLDDSAHHIFAVLLADAGERARVRQRLTDAGIQTSHHYPPVHEFSHYRARCPYSHNLDRTEGTSARELTLPLHPLLLDEDVCVVCTAFRQALCYR